MHCCNSNTVNAKTKLIKFVPFTIFPRYIQSHVIQSLVLIDTDVSFVVCCLDMQSEPPSQWKTSSYAADETLPYLNTFRIKPIKSKQIKGAWLHQKRAVQMERTKGEGQKEEERRKLLS